MPPSTDLLDHWAEAFNMKPATPPETPDEKFKRQLEKAGLGVVPNNPARDPLWLEASVFDERQRVRKAYELWNSPGTLWDEADALVQLNSGEIIHPHDLRMRLDRKAYEMLKRGADERTIAAACHMSLEEVQAVKARHEIH